MDRKCSKCKRLCRGHVGPYGSLCTMDDETEQSPEGPEEVSDVAMLVRQMSVMNTNIEGMVSGQQQLIRALQPSSPAVANIRDAASVNTSSVGVNNAHASQISRTTLLPNGVRIMEKAATRAKNGEFVNMADFIAISESEIDTDLEPVLDSEGKLLFRSNKSNRSIDNLLQWMSAWNNYEFLMVTANPSRYGELAKYRNFIQKCAKKFMWYAVYAYDCRFRSQITQIGSSRFGSVDTDLYTAVFDVTAARKDTRACHRCKSHEHVVTDCPFPAPQAAEPASKKTDKRSTNAPEFEICNNFNSGRYRYPSCRRRHICYSCGGSEPAYRCTCRHSSPALVEQPRLGYVSRPPPRS